MGLVNLTIHARSTTGKNENRRSRAAGRLPAILYGKGRPTENIELDSHELGVALLHLGGHSAIFSLEQEGRKDECIALLREVQKNPVTDEVLHVDLMEIPRGEPVTVPVAVEVVGTNQAVKSGEGSVVTSLNAIELSCRPSQLPECIEIDISELGLNDKVFVKDLEAPVGEFVTDPEALVLNIMPATVFIEEEEVEEGEEGAEGAEEDEGAEARADGDEEKKED